MCKIYKQEIKPEIKKNYYGINAWWNEFYRGFQ